MNYAYTLIVLCTVFSTLDTNADQPIEVSDYSFVRYSPDLKAYAVQSVLSSDTSNWTVCARLQVFNTSDGVLRWQAETNYGWSSQVHLATDPDHIVSVNTYINTQALRRKIPDGGNLITFTQKEGAQVITLNPTLTDHDTQAWLATTWAVRIYHREKLIQSYSLADLGISFYSLELSVSHASFASLRCQNTPTWDDRWPQHRGNPHFRDTRMRLSCHDGKTRTFNLKSGKLLSTEHIEELQQSPESYFRKSNTTP